MDAETLKKAIHPLLKASGFKRSGTTWRREQDECIAVLNVQKTQWGSCVYYINVGVYFRALGNEASPYEHKCHVRTRLENEEPNAVVTQAVSWFDARATLKSAALLAESDSKRGLVFKEVRHAAVT